MTFSELSCTLSHEKSFIFTDLPTGVELMTTLESEGLTEAEIMVSSILKDLCHEDLFEGNISNENIEFVFIVYYSPLHRRGGILFYLCPSFRLSVLPSVPR